MLAASASNQAAEIFPTLLICLTVFSAVIGIAFLVLPIVLQRKYPVKESGPELADEKTRLDIEDLRFGWMRTLGTAVLTAGIAVGGWYVQQRGTAEDLKQKERMAATDRQYRDDQAGQETLSRYLGELGDVNVTKRIAAASYLLQVYPTAKGVQRNQILDALPSRIVLERDSDVVDYLSLRIIDLSRAGNRAALLAAATDANRRAAFAYARDLGLAVGQTLFDETTPAQRSSIPEIGDPFTEWPDGDDRVKAIVHRFTDFTSFGSIMLSLRGHADGFYQFKYDPNQHLAGVFRRNLIIAAKGSAKTRRRTDDDVANDAFALKNTGILLSSMIRDVPTNPDGLDLRGTFFPFVDLSNARLNGADLRNAVIAGTLTGAQFDFANLEGANLLFARGAPNARQASMRAANLRNAAFLPQSMSFDFHPWLQGSNWQSTIEWSFNSFRNYQRDDRERFDAGDKLIKHEYDQCLLLAAAKKRVCPWTL